MEEEVYRRIITRLLKKKLNGLSYDVELRIDYSPVYKLDKIIDVLLDIKNEEEILKILA